MTSLRKTFTLFSPEFKQELDQIEETTQKFKAQIAPLPMLLFADNLFSNASHQSISESINFINNILKIILTPGLSIEDLSRSMLSLKEFSKSAPVLEQVDKLIGGLIEVFSDAVIEAQNLDEEHYLKFIKLSLQVFDDVAKMLVICVDTLELLLQDKLTLNQMYILVLEEITLYNELSTLIDQLVHLNQKESIIAIQAQVKQGLQSLTESSEKLLQGGACSLKGYIKLSSAKFIQDLSVKAPVSVAEAVEEKVAAPEAKVSPKP